MPDDMPAAGYVTDLLLFAYVAATLLVFAVAARRSGRRRLGTALAILGAAGVLLVAAEGWLRYAYDEPADGLPTLATRAWFKRHWHPQTNADGFRDHEWTWEKPPGTTRIVLLGDEAAGGYGVDDLADRVGDRLAAALGPDHEVWTAALPGWDSRRILDWLARNAARTAADRVIVLHSLDDGVDLVPAANLDVQGLSESRPTWWNSGRSFLFDEIWVRTMDEQRDWMQARIAAAPSPAARQKQTERLRRIAAVGEAIAVRLDVAVLPWFDTSIPSRDAVADAALRDWRAVCRGEVLDLRATFAGREDDFRVGSRAPWPDAEGHAALAETLLTKLFR